jgi:hypothetical protein
MARNSYEMSELRREVSRVAQDTQGLQAQVREKQATLADQARGIGMVAAEDPAMVRLSDGAVLGGAQEEAGQ